MYMMVIYCCVDHNIKCIQLFTNLLNFSNGSFSVRARPLLLVLIYFETVLYI